MKNAEHHIDAWALRVFASEEANGLHTLDEELYETLTNEEKIAFILAGGVPTIFAVSS